MLMNPFDATGVDPTQGIPQLPNGKHPVIIESSSIETVKAGDGGMLVLILRIIDGPAKGASGAYRLNLYSSSAKASEIAHRQLSALCHITRVFRITAADELYNIPFIIDVQPQKDNPQYSEVTRVYDINGNEPGKAPANGAAPAQPQQAPAPAPAAPAAAPAAWGAPAGAGAAPAAAPAAWGAPAPAAPAPAPAAAPAAAWGAPANGGAAAPAAAPAWGAPAGAAGGAAPWGAPR
jgi:hypothetical protein